MKGSAKIVHSIARLSQVVGNHAEVIQNRRIAGHEFFRLPVDFHSFLIVPGSEALLSLLDKGKAIRFGRAEKQQQAEKQETPKSLLNRLLPARIESIRECPNSLCYGN